MYIYIYVYIYIYICYDIYIYIYIYIVYYAGRLLESHEQAVGAPTGAAAVHKDTREFTKGGLVKWGLAIYAFPLCNCNELGSVFNEQIENIPSC